MVWILCRHSKKEPEVGVSSGQQIIKPPKTRSLPFKSVFPMVTFSNGRISTYTCTCSLTIQILSFKAFGIEMFRNRPPRHRPLPPPPDINSILKSTLYLIASMFTGQTHGCIEKICERFTEIVQHKLDLFPEKEITFWFSNWKMNTVGIWIAN